MRKSASYETDNGAVTIRPNTKDYITEYEDGVSTTKRVEPYLAYITIFTNTGKVHINAELVSEIREMLGEIEKRYITKEA